MEAGQLWGYIVGALGLLMGILGWLRNTKGDTSTQATWMGTVNAKLDHISSELSQLNGMGERVALVDASAKSAHKRIDDHLRFDHQKATEKRGE